MLEPECRHKYGDVSIRTGCERSSSPTTPFDQTSTSFLKGYDHTIYTCDESVGSRGEAKLRFNDPANKSDSGQLAE
jgi:hypothetical protein